MAKIRLGRFDRWHQGWRKHCTTSEGCKSIDSWFLGSDTSLVIPQFVNLPEAPFRMVRKYKTNKKPDFYAFPNKEESKSEN
jgi:hypothetical protein